MSVKMVGSILDYVHQGLDYDVWDKDGKLHPQHKEFILDTLFFNLHKSGFEHYLEWIRQVNIVGSLTTYQYVSDSDVDVHIIVDLPTFIKSENLPFTQKEAHEFLDAFRKVYDNQKPTLPGTKHSVEFFFQTPFVNQKPHAGSGIYNLEKDDWSLPPVSVPADFEVKTFLLDIANAEAEEMDISLGRIKRRIKQIEELQDVIKEWSGEERDSFRKKLDKKLEEIEKEIKDLAKEREKVVMERRNYSPDSQQEITFKYLQKFGYLYIIKQLMQFVEDEKKVQEEDVPEIKEVMTEQKVAHAVPTSDPGKNKLMIDFDDTISNNHDVVWPEIGEPFEGTKEALEQLKQDGWEITIYSARATRQGGVDQIKEFMEKYQIPYDEIFVGKPDAEFYIDDKNIVFTNWKDVLEHVKQHSVHDTLMCEDDHTEMTWKGEVETWTCPKCDKEKVLKKAYLEHAYWIAPNGKVYTVRGDKPSDVTHREWIENNKDMLEKEYGFDIFPTDNSFYTSILIDNNWIKIGDSVVTGHSAVVRDLNKIPSFVDDVLVQFLRDGNEIIVEDMKGQDVIVTYPWEKSLQDAVNKALATPTKTAQNNVSYDFSSTQVDLPKDVAQQVIEWGVRNIPDEDLWDDETKRYGRELEPHVTVKYGLLTIDPKDVEKLLKGEKPVKLKFGKTKFFKPENYPHEVINIDVESPDLNELNKKIEDNLENEDLYDSYHPHVTIAYVKEGLGKKYLGLEVLPSDLEVEIDSVLFSAKTGDKHSIKLGSLNKEAKIKFWAIYNDTIYVEQNPKQFGNHVKWFESVGLPTSGTQFDKITRGYSDDDIILYYKDTGNEDDVAGHWNALADQLGIKDPKFEKMESRFVPASFSPSIVQAPDNPWQTDSDVEIPVDPDTISTEETYFAPQVDKPRDRSFLKRLLDVFIKNKQEKEAIAPPNVVDYKEHHVQPLGFTELISFYEGAPKDVKQEVDSLIEEGKNKEAWLLIEKFLGRRHLKMNLETEAVRPKPKTHWDDPNQDMEPFKPLPVTYSPETNEENLNWRYPWKFMRKPTGPFYSNTEDDIRMLIEQEEENKTNKKADPELVTWDSEQITVDELTLRIRANLPAKVWHSFLEHGTGRPESFHIVPTIIKNKFVGWQGVMGTQTLPVHLNQWIQKITQDHHVVPVVLTQELQKTEVDKSDIAKAAGRFTANAKIRFDPKGAHKPGSKWGLSWFVAINPETQSFLKALHFNVTAKGLTDDDDIKRLTEFGFNMPSDTFIEEVRQAKDYREYPINQDVELIKNSILNALSTDKTEYDILSTYFDEGLQSKGKTGKEGSTYTDKEMEKYYVEQHEYNDSDGGGNVYHDWNQSTTDYPKPKDLSRPKVLLDRLTTPPNNIMPSYEVSWYAGTPNDEYNGDDVEST